MDRLLDYFTNHPFLAGGLVLMALVVIAYEMRRQGQGTSAVAPNDAIRMMNEGAVLVDLRPPNQFKDGHVAGARNVPGDQIADGAKALEKLGGKTLIMCCDNGSAAGAAVRTLARAGFKNVFSLRGGLAAWRNDNLPIVKG
ncbi:MAG: rhodanese-like domain-containing protein [Gammaproteobacteria bacterium]|nr:rhodanese-like domain-containing protein [Gammaproteobacteria bacterium]